MVNNIQKLRVRDKGPSVRKEEEMILVRSSKTLARPLANRYINTIPHRPQTIVFKVRE